MIRRFRVATLILAATAVATPSARTETRGQTQQSAQTTNAEIEALRKQVEALAAGQLAIERQLQDIKTLLQQGAGAAPAAAPAGPPPVASVNTIVETAGAPSKGTASARVTIVEFSDFQCPFCGVFARDTLAVLDREYIQTGKVRYVFRQYPLESIHPNAFKAAIAAACAAEQGKFWQVHDRLFANQTALAAVSLPGYAQAAGLDMATFTSCFTAGRPASRIRQDQADGAKAGVGSTPTFLIGRTTAGDSRLNATRIVRGAQPYATFKSVIDSLLAAK